MQNLPLKTADMVAVIERTNLKPSLENFLLPVFESISNSLHSISDDFGREGEDKGHISIEIFRNPASIIIRDNGPGLNYENFEAFRTPFTGRKLRKGGKGFGRFISFKVFDEIYYSSRHEKHKKIEEFAFKFDINSETEIIFIENMEEIIGRTGCTVVFQSAKTSFEKYLDSASDNKIIDHIIRYFLPYFAGGKMPKLEIAIDNKQLEPAERFKEIFDFGNTIEEKIEIDGEVFDFKIGISLSKKGELFPKHAMLLFADDRVIGTPRSIERKIGSPHFLHSDGTSRVAIASVSGEYLNNRANTARTSIEASEEEIDVIANKICEIVLSEQKEYTATKRASQKDSLTSVFSRNPLLRTAVREDNLGDYISSKPMSWGAEEFVSDLALRRYRDQGRWERELADKLKNAEALEESRDQILKHIESESKEALAAYVTHRKTVIEIAEKTLGIQEDGKTSLEDVFHDLVYPRYADSHNTKFYQHNLWLLDDSLSFVSYISSDRTIHGGRRQAGDKVADLILFDACSVFSNSDSNALVLVEFKRPGRDDFKFGDSSHDPIQQVFETVNKIRTNKSLISTDGRRIDVPDGTRMYCYIVADIEPSLKLVLDGHDFDPTWDQRGFYRYHDKRDAFVEVLGFDKLLSDAKKRNSAFFDILLGDLA